MDYVKRLVSGIAYVESKTFNITVDNEIHKVEFVLEMLPNDMKFLAILAGELTNAATYFTTFANVCKSDSDNLKKSFSLETSNIQKPKSKCQPWDYEKRLLDVPKVEAKKKTITKPDPVAAIKELTSFIASLKSRQEFIPSIGKYLDKARCEPLHLKNNVAKEMYVLLLDLILSSANLPKGLKLFKDQA